MGEEHERERAGPVPRGELSGIVGTSRASPSSVSIDPMSTGGGICGPTFAASRARTASWSKASQPTP